MISVINIPQLNDNYSYAITKNKEIVIIDPAESISILKYIENNQLILKGILITHHHSDHTMGIEGILNQHKVRVYSPNSNIKKTTNIIKDKDIIDLNFIKIKVIDTPGHTIDHVVFYNEENNLLFSGDTLFRLGCGRIFEGSYKQMYNSLKKIDDLNNKTNVYCGHEYTNTNLNFLLSIFPKNENLLDEKKKIDLQLKKTKSSIPFNLGREKNLNPFLTSKSNIYNEFKDDKNLSNFELFSYLRDLKNNF